MDDDPVDGILCDPGRAAGVRSGCLDGCFDGCFDASVGPGHPLGLWRPARPAEVASGRVRACPQGDMTVPQHETRVCPEPVRTALAEATGEIRSVLAAAAGEFRSRS